MKNVWEPEVRVEQNRIDNTILDPVLHWFFESAIFAPGVLSGAPPIEQIDYRWHWPPLPELDAVESAQAAMLRMSSGLSGPSEEYARRGADWNSESQRAAADFGVTAEEYKRAVFAKVFQVAANNVVPGESPSADASVEMPQGEYTELGQRAYKNNMKRIQTILTQVQTGEMTPTMARVNLESIGLATERIDKLMAEVTAE